MSYILECDNLCKSYGSKVALDHINLYLEPGHIIGLLGPNGSGKTTLIKLINELLSPTSGTIKVNGSKPGVESKSIVSYLPDTTYLEMDQTVKEVIDLFSFFYKDFDSNKAYSMLERLKVNPKDKLKSLSKGTKEKVQLVLVMSRSALLYVLDEPIAGVDPAARDFILKIILENYNPNATILISTHLIADIESVLDEAVFIQDGQIILHKSKEEITNTYKKTIDEYFREVFAC